MPSASEFFTASFADDVQLALADNNLSSLEHKVKSNCNSLINGN